MIVRPVTEWHDLAQTSDYYCELSDDVIYYVPPILLRAQFGSKETDIILHGSARLCSVCNHPLALDFMY